MPTEPRTGGPSYPPRAANGSPGPAAPDQSVRPQVINNGVKLIGEVLLPGASELLEGRIGKGVAAAGVGLGVPVLSAAVLGPVAALVVGGGTSLAVRFLSYTDSLTPETERDWHFGKSALDILDEKYANGEMPTDQYEERRKILMKYLS
jgi:uncharacterized membrane protein